MTWRSNDAAQNDTCLACIDCPDGMEPSIACGTVAKHGTHLHCVVCRDGTYSDTYGKEQCKPCTLCSVGRTMARNCSATKNARCGSCRYGYYEDDFVSDCLLCSVCCWDSRDQFEAQCKAQGLPRHRHCKPRHEDGCQPAWTTTRATPGAISVRSNPATTQQTGKSQLEATTVPLSPTIREHFASNKTRDKNTTSLPLPTTAIQLRKGTAPAKTAKSNDKNNRTVDDSSGGNKNRAILAVSLSMVILIIIVLITKRNKLVHFFKWARCRPICRSSGDAELSRDTESSFIDDVKAQLNVVPKGGT